jgi:peroxiredoxin Q/BCP
MVRIDHLVGNFTLASTGRQEFSLTDYLGKNIIIYFYPKDDTPGCTTEGQDFRDNWNTFTEKNCVIVGISRDSVESHESFKEKMQFPFELLSDTDETVCNQFNVIKMKNMYGKQVRGIERSTFVIDAKGILKKEWRGVKVAGHIQEILGFVSTM